MRVQFCARWPLLELLLSSASWAELNLNADSFRAGRASWHGAFNFPDTPSVIIWFCSELHPHKTVNPEKRCIGSSWGGHQVNVLPPELDCGTVRKHEENPSSQRRSRDIKYFGVRGGCMKMRSTKDKACGVSLRLTTACTRAPQGLLPPGLSPVTLTENVTHCTTLWFSRLYLNTFEGKMNYQKTVWECWRRSLTVGSTWLLTTTSRMRLDPTQSTYDK